MNAPHDHAKLRGGAPGESVQSHQRIQLTGSVLGARPHVYAGRLVEDEAKRTRVNNDQINSCGPYP